MHPYTLRHGRICLLCLLKPWQGFPGAESTQGLSSAGLELPHPAGCLGMRWTVGWGRAQRPEPRAKLKALKDWSLDRIMKFHHRDLESRWEKPVDHKDLYSLSLAVNKCCQHRKNCRCGACPPLTAFLHDLKIPVGALIMVNFWSCICSTGLTSETEWIPMSGENFKYFIYLYEDYELPNSSIAQRKYLLCTFISMLSSCPFCLT